MDKNPEAKLHKYDGAYQVSFTAKFGRTGTDAASVGKKLEDEFEEYLEDEQFLLVPKSHPLVALAMALKLGPDISEMIPEDSPLIGLIPILKAASSSDRIMRLSGGEMGKIVKPWKDKGELTEKERAKYLECDKDCESCGSCDKKKDGSDPGSTDSGTGKPDLGNPKYN
jgi:hypothetical protein